MLPGRKRLGSMDRQSFLLAGSENPTTACYLGTGRATLQNPSNCGSQPSNQVEAVTWQPLSVLLLAHEGVELAINCIAVVTA